MGTKVKAAPARRRAKQVGGTLAVTGVVAGVVLGTVAPARAGIPDSATRVAVSGGAASEHVDAHLAQAAAISGRLTSVAGGLGLSSGVVGAYRDGKLVRSGYVLDGDGGFTIRGLAAGRYAVCIAGNAAFGGGSSTGYLGRCFGGSAFGGKSAPAAAATVTVADGQAVTGKDIALPSAGGLSGKVTTTSGIGLRNVYAYAYDHTGKTTYFGVTDSAGNYSIPGLAPSSAYTVCFNPVGFAIGSGYQARCYRNVAWTGGGYPTATNVAVSAGHVTPKVNQALPVGGAVAGTVTDASTRKPVPNDVVVVFTAAGKAIGSAVTDAKGKYVVRGLAAASGDRVCASPRRASASTTYQGRCWKAVAWKGGRLPSATSAVGVKVGRTTGGINLALPRTVIRLGSITGKITDHAGHPLTKASVVAYTTSGGRAGSAVTASDGTYKIANLRANSTGYVVCSRQSPSTTASVMPAYGWAPHCSADVAWVGAGVPSGAKHWTIGGSAPWSRTGVNIALPDGGAITGTTFFGSDQATGGVTVKLFTADGRALATATSDFMTGAYAFRGLAARAASTGYVVCFDGRDDFLAAQGYRPQCFADVAWDGAA